MQAPPMAPPQRVPGTQPYIAPPVQVTPGTQPPAPGAPPRKRVQTCTLVKPGDRDPYAELLAGIPDLVPDSGFDSMAGNPDPSVQQELGGLMEMGEGGPPPVAHHPSKPPTTSVAPLKRG
jgi:hypothetical protein